MLSIYPADINQVIMVTVIATPTPQEDIARMCRDSCNRVFFCHKPRYRVIGCNKRKLSNSQFQIINLACIEVVSWILNVVCSIIISI